MSNGDGYVYSRRLDQAGLQALLEARQRELAYVMQESDADITFKEIAGLDQPWPRGRAFGETLEVRWTQEESGRYRVLLLSEVPQSDLAEAGWRVREGLAAVDGVRIYLWGRHYSALRGGQPKGLPHAWVEASDNDLIPAIEHERLPHAWVEARIPRELKYPWSQEDEWVYLQAVEYRDEGMVRLTRFKGLGGETRGGQR